MMCGLYSDPELYDLLFPEAGLSASIEDEARRARVLASQQFYLEEARGVNGRVLELGCGSGRLTIPIAQSGVEIIGADLSPLMLDAARAKAQSAGVDVRFVEVDMRAFNLPGRFDTILIPGNSFLHLLTDDDQRQCLSSVKRHLAPGGRFIFDVSCLSTELKTARHTVMAVGTTTIEEESVYDAAHRVRHITWFVSPGDRVIDYHLRVILPEELPTLLAAAGFRLEDRYGEFPRAPFTPKSPRQICLCQNQ